MPSHLQPLLHDSTVLLAAPTHVWSRPDGDMDGGVHGFYHSDTRLLSGVELRVGGERPESIGCGALGASSAVFTALARNLDDASADPRVRVDRRRDVTAGGLSETVTVRNALGHAIAADVAVRMRLECVDVQHVKSGTPEQSARAVVGHVAGGTCEVRSGTVSARLTAHDDGRLELEDDMTVVSWQVQVPAHGSVALRWSVAATDTAAVVDPAVGVPQWDDVVVRAGDSRLASWVRTALGDLDALRMTTRALPGEDFLAAGAPWFFTLFGRDSIWAARFLLPFGTDLAASTLRVLAELQGRVVNPETAEQPGKIMHELRAHALEIPGEQVTLPPLYYGTIDATPLWINLLHDAWSWGLADEEVEPLLGNLERALAWMRDYGDSDGDGFLEYVDTTGHGLANQGWKDSGDSIQWRDGTLAEGPIALCEVQAYAHEAALAGAELLDHFGRPGAEEWRAWAGALKARFTAAYWLTDDRGRYPAVALDVHKRPVDTVTSNIGHLLGTGILDPEDSAVVAARLASPELSSGYGLRTMSTRSAGYWPLSYHGGSVWAHDTAIAINGLSRAGHAAEAGVLVEGLLAAAEGFGYRMPELHSGESSTEVPVPVPYPAACRPQAWSAAASVVVTTSLLGLRPTNRTDVSVAPLPIDAARRIEVTGVKVGGRPRAVSSE